MNIRNLNPCYFRNAGGKHDQASGKLYCVIENQHLVLPVKRIGTHSEDKGKSIICVLYILRLAKRHVLMLISEEIKPVEFSSIKACLAEGIVSYLVRLD